MATTDDADGESRPYDRLTSRVKRLRNLGAAGEVLSWDQQTKMPPGGAPARSQQLAAISAVEHDLFTALETGELLAAADAETDDERALLREVGREYDRRADVPTALVERTTARASEAMEAWRAAREADEFEQFAPHLRDLVELKREYAAHVDPDRDPYEVLFEEFEPCLPLERAETILTDVRDAIVPLVDEVRASDVDPSNPFEGPYDEDDLESLVRDVLDLLDYPWDRGRLDTAPHPFSTGTVYDARITTRFDPDDPVKSVFPTVHEFGHACYTLGLPEEDYGTPLGEARDLSVHESQSRLWENHVGRSRPFLARLRPLLEEHLGVAPAVDALYGWANRVDPDNRIRVEADELTYHLHIVLRYEIERDLVRGDLDVADVPAVWNDKMAEYLGVRPESDAEGCLQDIHWSYGNFGYFPTYSLGSAMAAQVYEAASDDVDVADRAREGEFGPLRAWLREHVHTHGKRLETEELVRAATGARFTADAFTDYVTAKYGALYDI
ncbi:MAG: carboxypeptidase M32 [Haloferacaceae archaeon]